MPKIPVVSEAKIENTLLGGYVARHKCPHCNGNLKSKEKEIGKPDQCPDCGGVFAVSKDALEMIDDNKEKAIQVKRKKKQEKEEEAQSKQEEKQALKAAQRESDRQYRLRLDQLAVDAEERRQNEKQERQRMRSGGTSFCSDCGKEVSNRAQTCPHCGGPGPLTQATAGTQAIFIFCWIIVLVVIFCQFLF
ncbi:zf-TFIIB domain-containing protein [Planctomycetaceae bacterium]|nr:zf-TFIIB domain-containing protein [Planctomycetaceae bacterium]